MTGMVRRLAAGLILLSFIAGFAWSMDGHTGACLKGDASQVQGDAIPGDHCCHSSAHYLGLPCLPAATVSSAVPVPLLAPPFLHLSFLSSPPTPPPN